MKLVKNFHYKLNIFLKGWISQKLHLISKTKFIINYLVISDCKKNFNLSTILMSLAKNHLRLVLDDIEVVNKLLSHSLYTKHKSIALQTESKLKLNQVLSRLPLQIRKKKVIWVLVKYQVTIYRLFRSKIINSHYQT